MKQKDIAVFIAVAAGSAVVAFLISSKLVTGPKHRNLTAEKVPVISSEFSQPDPTYFNSQSVDPTVLTQIGNNSNTKPFNAAQ